MLTRLLHAAGLQLGPECDLMPAQSDNPDGFWENLRFVRINDQILTHLGGAWDLPPSSGEAFQQTSLDPIREEARSLLADFADQPLWGWKDPRNSLTLPFWKALIPNLRIVIIARNPLEVSHSMHRRNGTSHAFGLKLWESYNRRLLSTTTADERFVTHYDRFFGEPESELTRLGLALGLPEDALGRAVDLVASDRRHTHFTITEMQAAGVSSEVVDLYQCLVAEASSTGRPSAILPPKELQSPSTAPAATNRVDSLIVDRAAQRQDAQWDRLTERLQDSESRLENLRIRFLQINQLFQLKSIALSQAEERVVDLTRQLRDQLKTTRKLHSFLQDTLIAAQRLRQSRRWKISNPMAWAKSGWKQTEVPGFGHLEKVIGKFMRWREDHPELATLDASIQSLNPRTTISQTSASTVSFPSLPLPPLADLRFEADLRSDVSIIIPLFNQLPLTHACLAALAALTDEVSYEVIVVDDCSTDGTQKALSHVPGLVYLRNERNSGFIHSCNFGARQARSRYLVFLNNDTVVINGWLTHLLETFSHRPGAGLVGSKLLYPDSRLQEAGGIIWQDGSGWNRGKYQDAGKPEYNYLREVDYCSAASVMIPKALFESLGGFDIKYAPAYYEDTDLAFKVRRAGHQVLYQPLSVVFHCEGATGGTDLSSGTKKYQEVNRETFLNTWAEELAERPPNADIAAWDSPPPGKARILVIDHHLPLADRDSGSLRMFHILSILCRLGHRVTFIPDNLADLPPYGDRLRARGVEVIHHPYCNSVREYLGVEGGRFDAVILSRCDFAQKHLLDVQLHAPQARLIFDTVDLHFLREERGARLIGDDDLTAKAAAKRLQEYQLIETTAETWVVSPAESDLLREVCPGATIEVVSNIVDIPGSKNPYDLRRDILFIGSFQHPPNVDAILFFVREIFPFVLQQIPQVTFYVIGDHAPPEVIALADENVIIAGFQPDVSTYFDNIKLSIAPLRYGAGVKGKINQSLGYGVPVVATTIAAEGMGLHDMENVRLADEPVEFANAICQLYQTEEQWNRLSAAGLEITRDLYSHDAATKQLRRLFSAERLASKRLSAFSQNLRSPSGLND